ncbi:ArsR family transcriptional regulator, partial [Halobacteriales archaeon QS_7_69_60]
MSLLPSSPDVSPDSDPRLVGLDSDEAGELMAALSSETARRLLAELHEDPAPPGELADRVGTSLQNAQYHLEKLENAGAVEIVGTAYSEKGREMAVYGPADSPLVIYAGEQERASGLRAALSRLFAGLLALAVGSVAIQELFGRSLLGGAGSGGAGGGNGDGDVQSDAGETETPETGEGGNGSDEGVQLGSGEIEETDTGTTTATSEDQAGVGEASPTPEPGETPASTPTRTGSTSPGRDCAAGAAAPARGPSMEDD